MASDKTKTGQLHARVNPADADEAQHKAGNIGKLAHEIRDAAEKAGPMRKDVAHEPGRGG